MTDIEICILLVIQNNKPLAEILIITNTELRPTPEEVITKAEQCTFRLYVKGST